MKVILLKDVAKIGRRFDVVTVPDGYALNKLIPKSLAEAATAENLKRLQNQSAKVGKDREMQAANFTEALDKLKETDIEIAVEANNEGRMFQALKAEAIAEAVKSATGFELSSEHIVMKTPIKSIGSHDIDVISGEVRGTITVEVIQKTK